MKDKSEFFRLEDRASDHPFVEKVWRCHTDRADRFLSVAALTRPISARSLRRFIGESPAPRILERTGVHTLKLLDTKTFRSGVVALNYQPQ